MYIRDVYLSAFLFQNLLKNFERLSKARQWAQKQSAPDNPEVKGNELVPVKQIQQQV